nr:ATP-binding protein [Aquamicrobium sp.]
MELVMNSVDAGATKIDIDIDKTHFSIKDNGIGFESKKDVIELFGRFGKPHTEEEDERKGTVYGRFRMGRGQIMAFSKCSWRSSTFKMDVDIKSMGLTYDLSSDEKTFNGCHVSGEFYEHQDVMNFDNIENVLKYINIEVTLNGERIDRDPSKEQWDYENEYFSYRDDDNYSLSIYNQGVYVCNENVWKIGSGGTLVSKKRMEVNFARNDILITQCEVWKNFAVFIKKHTLQKDRDRARKKIPKHMRSYYYNEMKAGNIPIGDFLEYKIIQDQNGKLFSIFELFCRSITYIAAASVDGCTYAEYIAGLNRFFVFGHEERFNFDEKVKRGGMGVFFSVIKKAVIEELNNRSTPIMDEYDYFTEICDWLQELQFVKNIMSLSEQYPQIHKVFKDEELTTEEKHYLIALRKANTTIHSHVRGWNIRWKGKYKNYYDFPKRKLVVGDSMGGAKAWTDGFNYIVIDRIIIREAIEYGHNIIGAIIYLILHEYVHTQNNEAENVHGLDFYEDYHELTHGLLLNQNGGIYTTKNSFFDLISNTSKSIINRLQKNGLKVPAKTARIFNSINKKTIERIISELELFDIPRKKTMRMTLDDEIGEWVRQGIYIHDLNSNRYQEIYNTVAQSIAKNKNNHATLYIRWDNQNNKIAEVYVSIGDAKLNLRTDIFPTLSDKKEYIKSYMNRLNLEMSFLGFSSFWLYDLRSEANNLKKLIDYLESFLAVKLIKREQIGANKTTRKHKEVRNDDTFIEIEDNR